MDDEFEFSKLQNDFVYDSVRDLKAVKDPKTLTKSKFLNALQCPKLLWIRCNAPDQIPPTPDSLQRVFDTGHRVGSLAMKRFPGGVHVQEENFMENIQETKSLLSAVDPRPIYEAGIKTGRLYARADILVPSKTNSGAWDVVEVKCGTSVKEIYLQDVAFQRYCYEQAGIKVGRCFLMHINNEYVRHGEIDVEAFFTLEDVTEEIVPFFVQLAVLLKGFFQTIDMPACPNISISEGCTKKSGVRYDCPMKPVCWAFLPAFNVLELTRGKKKGFDLVDQGILRLVDIPDGFKLTDNQMIQRLCTISNQAHVDQPEISGFLQAISYPLRHMDFETIFEAIPRFDGTRPYQQVPFQFSVHLEETPGATPKHFEFLHKSSDDPRPAFVKALKACLGSDGTILAWNKSFEEGRIKELGEAFPEYSQWAQDVLPRTEDLMIPFSKYHYHHPDQHGSASLKKVLPAFIGKTYAGMAIGEGGLASSEYARVTYDENVNPTDRAKVYADLEAYCGLDTQAMVDILKKLKEIVRS
ncbi:MAG: DUF2779 domain-containing protein [Candidatus Omnitrophica bacterium]|nr:DUF2779 domain-containing protein [Candidatus Omnitrophota bacterium]